MTFGPGFGPGFGAGFAKSGATPTPTPDPTPTPTPATSQAVGYSAASGQSDVSIINRALIKLGAKTILALNENTTQARVMSQTFAAVRDAEFDRRRWKFTIRRAVLPALGDAPEFGYARKFQVPEDYIRIIDGGDIAEVVDMADLRGGSDRALYSIEAAQILTDLPAPLRIRYIARVSDAALFPPSFCEALAARLAYETCELITQSDSKRELARHEYRQAISEASRARALETAPNQMGDDSWVAARRM